MGAIDILFIILSYFLGNISPSTLLARAQGLDIKKEGSGNAGTTNTLRVLGKKAALITLIVDVGKGVVAVLVSNAVCGHETAMWCALAVFLGHVWPVLLKFQGGKGVATAAGAIFAINWQLGLIALVIVVASVLITRRMSFGSIVVGVLFPFICWFMQNDFFPIGLVMALIMLFKHRSNMVRLMKGEESKISFGKKKEDNK